MPRETRGGTLSTRLNPGQGSYPGVRGAPLYPAVPTDPGILKLPEGPKIMAHVGLICSSHPCMGQKWREAELGVPRAH